MRNKLLILTLVIVLATLFLYKNKDSSKVVNKQSQQSETTIQETTSPDKAESVQDKLKTIKKAKQAELTLTESKQEEKIEIIEAVYDSDPVVDAYLILENNRSCYRLLKKNSRAAESFKRFEHRLDEKQKQHFKSLNKHCQQLNQKHPEYHLTDSSILRKQLYNAKTNSLWGKIIKSEIDPLSLSEYEVSDLLKQNNINILSQAPEYLEKHYQEVIHWQLEDVLQNHQYDYTNQIRNYAHQLYLCNLGADCGPHSKSMARLCYINSQSCGMDYPRYVSNVLTQGQQADIQLAIKYLHSQYQ